jgi:hypothetical protein
VDKPVKPVQKGGSYPQKKKNFGKKEKVIHSMQNDFDMFSTGFKRT